MTLQRRRVMVPECRPREQARSRRAALLCALALLCISQYACAPGESARERSTNTDTLSSRPPIAATTADSLAVVRVAERFDSLLTVGDSGAALALLAPDAAVLESGGLETRDQYRSHHLPADIQFLRAVPTVHEPLRAVVRGDVAWTIGTSTSQGTFRDRPVNSASAALMVLAREPDGWRIRAIHWSSRTRKP